GGAGRAAPGAGRVGLGEDKFRERQAERDLPEISRQRSARRHCEGRRVGRAKARSAVPARRYCRCKRGHSAQARAFARPTKKHWGETFMPSFRMLSLTLLAGMALLLGIAAPHADTL